jgi:DNA helicase-4
LKTTILVLGRNNYDINKYLNSNFILTEENKIVYLENNDINIYYLTTHKSKGLEEENVIIINVEDNIMGFPNKIIDDPILKYVKENKEYYPYEEERRLFYVALTRTKNNVYIMVNKRKESIFIKEIKKQASLFN